MAKLFSKSILAIALLILVGIIIYQMPKDTSEERIREALQEANYCEEVSDCVQLPSTCPFGCHLFVNKNEQTRLKAMLNEYESTCIYGCIALKGITCEQNKCKAVTE